MASSSFHVSRKGQGLSSYMTLKVGRSYAEGSLEHCNLFRFVDPDHYGRWIVLLGMAGMTQGRTPAFDFVIQPPL